MRIAGSISIDESFRLFLCRTKTITAAQNSILVRIIASEQKVCCISQGAFYSRTLFAACIVLHRPPMSNFSFLSLHYPAYRYKINPKSCLARRLTQMSEITNLPPPPEFDEKPFGSRRSLIYAFRFLYKIQYNLRFIRSSSQHNTLHSDTYHSCRSPPRISSPQQQHALSRTQKQTTPPTQEASGY